jgi:hypothetical protein
MAALMLMTTIEAKVTYMKVYLEDGCIDIDDHYRAKVMYMKVYLEDGCIDVDDHYRSQGHVHEGALPQIRFNLR